MGLSDSIIGCGLVFVVPKTCLVLEKTCEFSGTPLAPSADNKWNEMGSVMSLWDEATPGEGRNLLLALDYLVRSEGGVSGLRGKICVGVQTGPQQDWWQVVFGNRTDVAFVPRPDSDADAVFLLGEREAESILETGELPPDPQLLQVAGSKALLHRFVDRYTASMTTLDLRSGAFRAPADR